MKRNTADTGSTFRALGVRVEMLDEALTVIRRLWTEDAVTFDGRHYRLRDALANPKPLQKPHPPIVIGGEKPKMLRVIARHADEWNVPSHGDVAAWAKTSALLDEACAEVGRDPAEIRRSVQLFVLPAEDGHLEEQLARLPELESLGCDHAVLSFYQPPSAATVGALRGTDLVDQVEPPGSATFTFAPGAPSCSIVSGSSGVGARRDRRSLASSHTANDDSVKLTAIIRTRSR